MPINTGLPKLDNALNGGFPENRATLVVGGPGVGKSTFAMQYLQEGLDNGDNCLFVSTEQTAAEIHDSFAPYGFETDHSNLTVTTIHAMPGRTIESGDEEVLTITSLTGEESVGQGFSAPFTGKYIRQMLDQHGPCDRVVVDSISGLDAMADDSNVYRRAVLDMIRLFTDEFEATSLFTAEDAGSDGTQLSDENTLQFNTHGVINLWREQVNGDYHRFLRVTKMRGVDHDTRRHEIEFRPDGITLLPKHRTRSEEFMQRNVIETGVPGLDSLCDGFLSGGTALLEHDGRADIDPMVISMVSTAIERDESIVLFPSANMGPQQLDRMLPAEHSIDEMLDGGDIFVFDFVGTWHGYHDNVVSFAQSDSLVGTLLQSSKLLRLWKIMRAVKRINNNRPDKPAFALLHTEALLQHLSPEEIRQMYYWAKMNVLREGDRVLFVQNPNVMHQQLAEFYAYDAEQILRTWLHEDGLQYVRLEKSPIGALGGTRLVKYIDEPPYVHVQQLRGESVDGGRGSADKRTTGIPSDLP